MLYSVPSQNTVPFRILGIFTISDESAPNLKQGTKLCKALYGRSFSTSPSSPVQRPDTTVALDYLLIISISGVTPGGELGLAKL